MTRVGSAVPVKTLVLDQGLDGLLRADLGYKVRRSALTALAIGALFAALSATSVALEGVADHGVTIDDAGTQVVAVSPTGFAWRFGVRPGDRVDGFVAADEPGGWQMVTHDAAGTTHLVLGAGPYAGVAASLPIGVIALALACLAVLFLSTRRRWVVPTASLALLAAGVPLGLQGGPDLPTVVMAGAAIVPAINIGRRVPLALAFRIGLPAAFIVFVLVWAAARLTDAAAFPGLESARTTLALSGALALFADRAVVPILRGEAIGLMRPRLFDVAVIAAFSVVGPR